MPLGVNWMEELVGAVKSGKIDLEPNDKSGWYDYKLFALAPLIRPDLSFALSFYDL